MKPADADPPGGLVWDLGVRAFHWLLVLLIGLAWWTYRSDLMTWHRRIGYAIAALLAFRIYWGFAGSAPARFANFVRSPADVGRYIRGQIPGGVGHNPAGGWSVLALLGALAVLVVTGLLGATQEGDLAASLQRFPSRGAARRRTSTPRRSTPCWPSSDCT